MITRLIKSLLALKHHLLSIREARHHQNLIKPLISTCEPRKLPDQVKKAATATRARSATVTQPADSRTEHRNGTLLKGKFLIPSPTCLLITFYSLLVIKVIPSDAISVSLPMSNIWHLTEWCTCFLRHLLLDVSGQSSQERRHVNQSHIIPLSDQSSLGSIKPKPHFFNSLQTHIPSNWI